MKLDNSKVATIELEVSTTYSNVEKQLYQVYKSLKILTQTNSFRGDGAEAVKTFMKSNSLNTAYLIVEAVKNLESSIKAVKSGFLEFESEETGKVLDSKVDDKKSELNKIAKNIDSHATSLEACEKKAGKFITVENSDTDAIAIAFADIEKKLKKVNQDFQQKDQELYQKVSRLTDYFSNISNNISQVMNNYVLPSGKYDDSKFDNLKREPWYIEGKVSVFQKKMEEDPFVYGAGSVANWEGQYAIGFSNDVYAYAGADAVSRNYEIKVQDGELKANGKVRLAGGELHANAGDLASVSATADLASLKGSTTIGKNGLILSAGGAVASAEATAKVANLVTAKASAKGPSADGTMALYDSEKKTQFGFSGSASFYNVSASVELDPLNAKIGKGDEQKRLFSLGMKPKVGAGGSAKLMYTREKVADINKHISIHSNRIEIGGQLGLGIDLDITVPSIQFKLW
ncbi:T7SS effector LXG polymorphic toxin [Streptococcus oralis]|uniref:LXG domain-containing protein n=1 Tax=Streptococcus oralis subsp. dentisani TaxID=1458253 RepID=A0A1X1J4A7_STROR|nr:T7SS effector LXG polymorphic toxin [Streptococcus oralis]ORO80218.1 hypothetical protein B7708_01025 [Streptococcus oralis subsp. dentisani]